MKKKIATMILAILCTSCISSMRTEAEVIPTGLESMEGEEKTGSAISIFELRTEYEEYAYEDGVAKPIGSKQNVAKYYLTKEGETFESISKRLGISEEDLISENSDYRANEDGTYEPFNKNVFVSVPENVPWNEVKDEIYYYVNKGDTLCGIAKYFQTSVEKVEKLNPQVVDINLIYVGDFLKIK